MLAGERVVRSELGEDRDHHLADLVPALGVVGARERLVERLEGGLVVTRVPGRERALQVVGAGDRAVAVRGRKPRAGGQAFGDEVAVEAVEDPERLLRLAVLEQHATEPRRRPDVARVDLERLSKRVLVAGLDEPVRLGGTRPSKKRSTCAGGMAPVNRSTT